MALQHCWRWLTPLAPNRSLSDLQRRRKQASLPHPSLDANQLTSRSKYKMDMLSLQKQDRSRHRQPVRGRLKLQTAGVLWSNMMPRRSRLLLDESLESTLSRCCLHQQVTAMRQTNPHPRALGREPPDACLAEASAVQQTPSPTAQPAAAAARARSGGHEHHRLLKRRQHMALMPLLWRLPP